MGQYRNGIITSTGAAVNLALGFVPDRFTILNYTKTVAGTGVGSEWINKVVPSAKALISTYTAGAPVVTLLASNGITPVATGGVWYNTNYTITGITNANPGVVTLSSLTPTGAQTLVNGDTVTISGVVGMTQLNENRYIVSGISGSTFTLYDLFGNPVDTTAFGTYASGGIANLISYPATAPTISATTGQITAQGNPAGNQYDVGYEGVTLGTGVVGSAADVLYWEAFYATPTGW
jgi:hypothetical protein